jgi:hypothetical protein
VSRQVRLGQVWKVIKPSGAEVNLCLVRLVPKEQYFLKEHQIFYEET